MKTLDRYILRQLIGITLLGVLSLTMLMLLGQLFKELHTLLVESGAPPRIVVDFICQVVPFSMTFTVPWGFLTAVLLVYGRLAADNELSSMRMAGLSLWRLSAPAIGLGIALSGLCYYINIEMAPKGKRAMGELVMHAAMDNPRNLLRSSQSATKLDKVQLYVEERDGDNLRGLHVYPVGEDEEIAARGDFDAIHAQEAVIGEFDRETRILHLTLHNATVEFSKGVETSLPVISTMPLQVHIPIREHRKYKSNRFTNAELAVELAHKALLDETEPDALSRYEKAAAAAPAFPCAERLWAELRYDVDLYNGRLDARDLPYFQTERVKRASFSLACFIFSLIGVPLAVTARRRDTSTGFALGILVAAAYFMALVFCDLTRKSGGLLPCIILWIPNILGIAFAVWQHQKAKFRG